jgi:hypothetical protein
MKTEAASVRDMAPKMSQGSDGSRSGSSKPKASPMSRRRCDTSTAGCGWSSTTSGCPRIRVQPLRRESWENKLALFYHLRYCEFRRQTMGSWTTVGFDKFHRDSKNHAGQPWWWVILPNKGRTLRNEASNSTSSAGANPGKTQLIILNRLTSGIYLGQGFQDGYPPLSNPTGASSTTAGMTEIFLMPAPTQKL